MTSPVISPTVGRVLWFYPEANSVESGFARHPDGGGPYAALISHVWSDALVNLMVLDADGTPHGRTSVSLLQDPQADAPDCAFCVWMPFQKGQAAKSEVLEKAVAQPVNMLQRDQLEYSLVSGAAAFLAQEPRRAGEIAEGIKKVLNTLCPTPQSALDQAATAPLVLPVVDPGPDSIEQEIQAKANKAPRVTPADIQASILREHYFTAADGAFGASMRSDGTAVPPADGAPMGLLTFCVLELCNGFTVTGESACASPENFNVEIGRRIARENAVAKLWPLLGFRLRDKLTAR